MPVLSIPVHIKMILPETVIWKKQTNKKMTVLLVDLLVNSLIVNQVVKINVNGIM